MNYFVGGGAAAAPKSAAAAPAVTVASSEQQSWQADYNPWGPSMATDTSGYADPNAPSIFDVMAGGQQKPDAATGRKVPKGVSQDYGYAPYKVTITPADGRHPRIAIPGAGVGGTMMAQGGLAPPSTPGPGMGLGPPGGGKKGGPPGGGKKGGGKNGWGSAAPQQDWRGGGHTQPQHQHQQHHQQQHHQQQHQQHHQQHHDQQMNPMAQPMGNIPQMGTMGTDQPCLAPPINNCGIGSSVPRIGTPAGIASGIASSQHHDAYWQASQAKPGFQSGILPPDASMSGQSHHLAPLSMPAEMTGVHGQGNLTDTQDHKFKTVLCRDWPTCPRGDNCTFAHSDKELKYNPKAKMALCRQIGLCKFGEICRFAHTAQEWKPPPAYKTM